MDDGRPDPGEVERAREGVRRMVARVRRSAIGGGILLTIVVPLAFWAHGPVFGLVIAASGVLTAAGIGALVLGPWLRRAHRAAASDGEVVAFYRSELDRSIRSIRRAAPFVWITVALVCVTIVLVAARSIREAGAGRSPDLRADVLNGLLFAVVIAMTVHTVRVRLPQLERERREMDG
jgi:hypothetical protein